MDFFSDFSYLNKIILRTGNLAGTRIRNQINSTLHINIG